MGWIHNSPDDTPTEGPRVTAVASVLTGIAFLFILIRVYVRGHLLRAFWIDDWIILVTWALSLSFTVDISIETTWGLGMIHIEDMPNENMGRFGALEHAGAPLYILSHLGFKLSLLVSYFRFVPQGMCKYGVTCVLITCTVFHLSCLIVQLNSCRPIAKQWDDSIDGKCINLMLYYVTSSALTVVFDFAVMFLPFPVLVKSKLPTKKKIVLLGLFALGFFITAIQIIRIQFINGTSNPLNSGSVQLWSAVELNLGIIVVCVPVLSPLFRSNRRSTKSTPQSSWANSNAPSWVVGHRITSEDHLYDTETSHTDCTANTGSHESTMPIGGNRIVKETNISVINQVVPAHMTHHHMNLGSEYWGSSANMMSSNSLSSHSFNQV
ncbi:uncharacterized protein F4822DRAFT_400101 [Hypoxylon trugodes]|uniref:uncharacterized protein n=1 Tax=Hypoxylon trugodes TaxID=326681 RepID=UPI0021976404|nr:uncharacterized protein F4822DRAFT_400101 [Hypoxylon trugodes]KAI1389876.1 hypothetical protein F4822DRAFT_400101 [Hypoxylon trugodes]